MNSRQLPSLVVPLLGIVSLTTASPVGAAEPTRDDVEQAMHRAVRFFRERVAAEGGYLWNYSADLKHREGEREAGPTAAWVQPPGTPTVGQAYLDAYELCGDQLLLEAARETALALVRGQLQSGGWDYRIEFDPAARKRYAYRVEGESAGKRNVTTFDDDTTQSAIRFLMHVDRALHFEDQRIHEAVEFALTALLKSQYPNGAWPQRFDEFPDPSAFPVKRASYPDTWSRTWPRDDYKGFYTFNDDAIADLIEVLFEAAAIYDEPRYRAAAEKAGGFILLAQMPEPQPGWAQQYDADMHPAWARKFEPPAVTGGEAQGVMRTLLRLYRLTGDRKYLEPIPRALAYYRKSLLPGGRLARFYELKTNHPLFFTKAYELTYEADDLPTHYGFIVSSKLDRIDSEYRQLLDTPPDRLNPPPRRREPKMSRSLAQSTREVLAALDARGAWVVAGRLKTAPEAGERIIDTKTFANRLRVLATYLAASD